MGRAPFGFKYCAVWRASFGSFASLERVLAPVYRLLLHARHAVVMGRGDQRRAEEVEAVAYQTSASGFSVGATPVELGGLLRAYINTLSLSVIRAIGAREALGGPEGGMQPLGVVAGMAFAIPTRASFSACVTWFQSSDWARVSRMLCGLRPTPPEDRYASGTVPGFGNISRPGAFG